MRSLSLWPALLQAFLQMLALISVYWWLQTPALDYYSLQAFALSVISYLILKRFNKAKLWQLVPSNPQLVMSNSDHILSGTHLMRFVSLSLEMAVITFAFLLLIGATGGISSPFFALTYVHLFFLVYAAGFSTSLITSISIVWFYYALQAEIWQSQLPHLIAIPVVMIFFLFSKRQFEEILNEQQMLLRGQQTLAELEGDEVALETFLRHFVNAKLEYLKTLVTHAEKNKEVLMGQLMLMQIEIEKILKRVRD